VVCVPPPLATASGLSDIYQHAIDEVLVADSAQGGSVNDLVNVAYQGLRGARGAARA
jgi:hypothetical protein